MRTKARLGTPAWADECAFGRLSVLCPNPFHAITLDLQGLGIRKDRVKWAVSAGLREELGGQQALL